MKSILKFTLAALMATDVEAIRCGELKMTQCTDGGCSENCVDSVVDPPGCGNEFLGSAFNTGSVATYCDNFKSTVKFFSKQNCEGQEFLEAKEYMYDICYTNDKGSMKLSPTGNRPQFFELTEQEYEQRFNQRWDDTSDFNVLGYGAFNRFVPPIMQPSWLLNELDRWVLLLWSNPVMSFFSEAFIRAFGTGDAWDQVWYNNAQAAGNQLYPTGLNKYFDMYSFSGWVQYIIQWLWAQLVLWCTPFTILPMNIWLALLNGENLDGLWKALIPFPIIWVAHLRGENGWLLA